MITAVYARSAEGRFGVTTAEGVVRTPWPYLSVDMRHFKEVTRGKAVLMGRRTFESLPPRESEPLPGRHSIVASRSPQWNPWITWTCDPDETVYTYKQMGVDLCIIGGPSLIEECWPHIDTILETVVYHEAVIPCAEYIYAPSIPEDFRVQDAYFTTDPATGIDMRFQNWVRINA